MLRLFALVLGAALLAGPAFASGTPEKQTVKPPVERFGRLHVENLRLVSESGQPVQLRGVSSHKISGTDWIFTPDKLDELVKDFHADVLRLAMYTDPREQGYAMNPAGLTKIIDQLVADTEAAGLYCIVDWHISNHDGNPNQRKDLAIDFFSRLAERYRDKKHLLFEICNEPSGPGVTWEDEIRPYAVDVLAAIRRFDPTRVVLVGTANWSQDIHLAARHPLDDPNVMYVFHPYVGSHGQELRAKVEEALQTVPVFCTEWGTTINTGNGPVFPQEAATWMKFFDDHGISSVNWSFSNTIEGSAALIGSYDGEDPLKESLTDSGRIVYDYLRAPR